MRPLALLALFVTTWSNAAALRCPSMAPAPAESLGESPASAEHHAHAGHAAPATDTQEKKGQPGSADEPESHSHAQECGLVMACGTALNGTGAALERDLAGSGGDILRTAATAPTTTDLSQEPPPPRRLA
jgi:hypothetical protein